MPCSAPSARLIKGRLLRLSLPFPAGGVTPPSMIWLTVLAASSSANLQEVSRTPAAPLIQARATVRILKGARLHFESGTTSEAPPIKSVELRLDGKSYPARLVEFE